MTKTPPKEYEPLTKEELIKMLGDKYKWADSDLKSEKKNNGKTGRAQIRTR